MEDNDLTEDTEDALATTENVKRTRRRGSRKAPTADEAPAEDTPTDVTAADVATPEDAPTVDETPTDVTPDEAPTVEPPPEEPIEDRVSAIQRELKVEPDGEWGPVTDKCAMQVRLAARKSGEFDVELVQEIVGATVDGVWGALSQRSLTNWIVGFQNAINLRGDGRWGPRTDGKVIALRRRYFRAESE